MYIYLDESESKQDLRPISALRHVADIRIGILTIREKWALLLSGSDFTLTANPDHIESVTVSANIVPDSTNFRSILDAAMKGMPPLVSDHSILKYPWHIFQHNAVAIRQDFTLLNLRGIEPQFKINNSFENPDSIYIDPTASLQHCILNASEGPIYIGKNVTIMEGTLIRGPFVAMEGTVIKMGTRIYGATTLGPRCTVGGELKNVVFQGYSNKAHDGYLGDSVIGSWCNLGAGTSNSNVKNSAGEVFYKAYHYTNGISAGQKAGLVMGDFSRTAINTSINTGTIIGVSCNVFTSGLTRQYIPDFTWGDESYETDKAIRDAKNWMRLKGEEMGAELESKLREAGKK